MSGRKLLKLNKGRAARLNPLDRPTLCPFCLQQAALSSHVGACPAVLDENPQAAELPQVTGTQPTIQDQIKTMLEQPDDQLLDQTVQAWSAMFESKLGRPPTTLEKAKVRALAQANLNKLRGV